MSDTPRTDAAWKPDGGDGYPTVDIDFARKLERELNAANRRIKRLEEDGDDCANLLDAIRPNTAAFERWCLAKEAKP